MIFFYVRDLTDWLEIKKDENIVEKFKPITIDEEKLEQCLSENKNDDDNIVKCYCDDIFGSCDLKKIDLTNDINSYYYDKRSVSELTNSDISGLFLDFFKSTNQKVQVLNKLKNDETIDQTKFDELIRITDKTNIINQIFDKYNDDRTSIIFQLFFKIITFNDILNAQKVLIKSKITEIPVDITEKLICSHDEKNMILNYPSLGDIINLRIIFYELFMFFEPKNHLYLNLKKLIDELLIVIIEKHSNFYSINCSAVKTDILKKLFEGTKFGVENNYEIINTDIEFIRHLINDEININQLTFYNSTMFDENMKIGGYYKKKYLKYMNKYVQLKKIINK